MNQKIIKGLLQADVLGIILNPQRNTPLLPVKKPDDSYRLVHDLRAVNEVVANFPADVPDPQRLHSSQWWICVGHFSVFHLA